MGYTQGTRCGMGPCGSFADWRRHIYWVGEEYGKYLLPAWSSRGERLHCSEDLKPISSYNMGEGGMIRVWFFRSCIPRPTLVSSALLSLGHHGDQTTQGPVGHVKGLGIYSKHKGEATEL